MWGMIYKSPYVIRPILIRDRPHNGNSFKSMYFDHVLNLSTFWNRNLNTFIFQQTRHVNTTEVDRLWTHYPNTSSLSPLHWIMLSQDRIRSDITNLFLLLSYQSSLLLFRRISPNHIFFHLSKPICSGVFFDRVSILKQRYIWNCMLDISEESIISRLYFSFPHN